MSQFSETVGIYPCKGELDEEAQAERINALAQAAGVFLRGWGRLTLADWLELTEEERSVFAVVGDQLAAQRSHDLASLLGASRDPVSGALTDLLDRAEGR